MCVGVPMKIIEIKESKRTGKFVAVAEIDGVKRVAKLDHLEKVRVGDYVVVHATYAISLVSKEEAEATLAMMKEVYAP